MDNWGIVPPTGPVDETVIDRRTNRSWTVHVEPFELATTVVTQQQYAAVLPTPPSSQDRPQVACAAGAMQSCSAMNCRAAKG